MDHWFDELTRQMAAKKPSRRAFATSVTATVAAVASGSGWQRAFAGPPCLIGQWTTDGKCCHGGTACGTSCCQYGCADAKSSTCKPTISHCPPGLWKCTSKMAHSNATEIICCPKNAQCFNGKCCAPGLVVCNSTSGNHLGCWKPSLCLRYPS